MKLSSLLKRDHLEDLNLCNSEFIVSCQIGFCNYRIALHYFRWIESGTETCAAISIEVWIVTNENICTIFSSENRAPIFFAGDVSRRILLRSVDRFMSKREYPRVRIVNLELWLRTWRLDCREATKLFSEFTLNDCKKRTERIDSSMVRCSIKTVLWCAVDFFKESPNLLKTSYQRRQRSSS